MRYIVTGGAGFIGSHLCEALVADDHEVVIIDDLSSGCLQNITDIIDSPLVKFHQESVLNLASMRELFQGADGVFHQAALVSVPLSIEDPARSHAITLTGTLHVLLAARDAGVKKVVSASSAAVYGNLPGLPKTEHMPIDPASPYAVEKHCGEEYSRVFSSLYGLSTVCLRYFNVYGPRQDPHSDYAAAVPKFIERIKNNQAPIIYGDGEQTRDFVFVKDVVDANIRAMSSDQASGVYNIAQGKGTSIRELAHTILKVLGSDLVPVYQDARPGEVKHSLADGSRARRDFGFSARYSLEQGLSEMMR